MKINVITGTRTMGRLQITSKRKESAVEYEVQSVRDGKQETQYMRK